MLPTVLLLRNETCACTVNPSPSRRPSRASAWTKVGPISLSCARKEGERLLLRSACSSFTLKDIGCDLSWSRQVGLVVTVAQVYFP